MATCTSSTGMLLWKKPCGMDAMGNCRNCHAWVCMRHGATLGDGSILCTACANAQDDSTGTVFHAAPLIAGAAIAQAGSAEETRAADATWHGDSSPIDAGFDSGLDAGGDAGSTD